MVLCVKKSVETTFLKTGKAGCHEPVEAEFVKGLVACY